MCQLFEGSILEISGLYKYSVFRSKVLEAQRLNTYGEELASSSDSESSPEMATFLPIFHESIPGEYEVCTL